MHGDGIQYFSLSQGESKTDATQVVGHDVTPVGDAEFATGGKFLCIK